VEFSAGIFRVDLKNFFTSTQFDVYDSLVKKRLKKLYESYKRDCKFINELVLEDGCCFLISCTYVRSLEK